MLTYPFQIIKLRLETDVPELQEIDWFLDQDATNDKNVSLLSARSAYIEFADFEIETLGGRIQSAPALFNIHLLTDNVLDSGKRMKKDQPIDHMRIFDRIYKSLHGFGAKISFLPEFAGLAGSSQDQRVMNSISRVHITPPHKPRKGFMKSIQRFKCVIYDHAACKQWTSIPKPPADIEAQIG
jgi:hypothetical protein